MSPVLFLMKPHMKSSSLAMLGLILAMLIWGSSFIAFKIVLEFYPPMFIVAARMGIASLVFILIWRLWYGKWDYREGDWKIFLVMAACEPCLYFLFEAWALKFTTASEAGVMTSMLPMLVAIMAGLMLSEKIGLYYWVGLVISMPGVIWLSLSGEPGEQASNPMLGNFLELCAMVVAAVYTVALRFLSSRYSTWLLTSIQAFAGFVFFLPLFLIFEFQPFVFHFDAMVLILYLGSIVTLVAYGLYNHGIKVLSASQATIFTNLIPVFTLILAFVILGERISFEQYMAVVMIMAGVLISQVKEKAPDIPVETF